MKKQFLTGILAASMLTMGSALLPSSAEAFSLNLCTTPYGTLPAKKPADPPVPTPSPVNLADNVTNTIGCQYVTPATNATNDQGAGGFNINTQLQPGFFGFNDWYQNEEYFNGLNNKQGSLDLDNLIFKDDDGEFNWRDASQVLLLLKDGNNTSTLVGYLYDLTRDGSFNYSEPWAELFGTAKDVSHISVYFRRESTPVPAPALIPSLIGVGVAALRKKKREEKVTQEA